MVTLISEGRDGGVWLWSGLDGREQLRAVNTQIRISEIDNLRMEVVPSRCEKLRSVSAGELSFPPLIIIPGFRFPRSAGLQRSRTKAKVSS
jgi:hypothetical protein